MKRLIFVLASLFAFGVYSGNDTIKAQGFSISINIGVQPAWGPVGYDYVDYYYIPEIDCYYDVPRGIFYYVHNGRWVSGRYLPPYYSRYDLYRLHKVVINGYHQPWRYHSKHYSTYRHYVGRYDQRMIRYSRDARYDASRRNRHDWVENGRDLHNRSNRTYSEGQSSSGRNSTRRSEATVGRSSSQNSTQGRRSSTEQGRQNQGGSSANGGRSSSSSSAQGGRSSVGQNSGSQQRTSGTTVRQSSSSSSGRSSGAATVRSGSQRNTSSSSSTRATDSGSSSSRGSGEGRTSNR